MGLDLGGQAGRGLFGGDDVMDIGAGTSVFLFFVFFFFCL